MLEDEILSELKVGLFAGHYNLLLGSGASLDSFGSDRQPLIGAKTLTRTLNDLKGVDSGTPLSRVSLLLSPDEVKTHPENVKLVVASVMQPTAEYLFALRSRS